MLVKLRPGVNFTNVIHAAFMYESCECSFFVLTFLFVLYWCKTFSAKAGRRLLVKLTPDVEVHFFSDVVEECYVQSTKLLNARIVQ